MPNGLLHISRGGFHTNLRDSVAKTCRTLAWTAISRSAVTGLLLQLHISYTSLRTLLTPSQYSSSQYTLIAGTEVSWVKFPQPHGTS